MMLHSLKTVEGILNIPVTFLLFQYSTTVIGLLCLARAHTWVGIYALPLP